MANESGKRGLSDAEKKARGTFEERYSEENRMAAAGAKVVTGLFLPRVPEPELPLDEHGRAKYFTLAEQLLQQGKLTITTQLLAESAASSWQEIKSRMAMNIPVSNSLMGQFTRTVGQLRLADAAQVPSGHAKKQSKFAGVGFSVRTYKAG